MSEAVETRVAVAQIFCPAGHCILASAAALRLNDVIAMRKLGDELEGQFDKLVKGGAMQPYCGVCGSSRLHVEVGVTLFTTMEEAEPALARLRARQHQPGQHQTDADALRAQRMAELRAALHDLPPWIKLRRGRASRN